jgi:adenine phosphoribosyltransferase
MQYEKKMQEYIGLELQAHVTPEQVLNKVTQEILELKLWNKHNDIENIAEETRDAIVNILSATYHAGVMVDEQNLQRDLVVTNDDLDITMLDWNEAIQGKNRAYSRKVVSTAELQKKTETFLSTVLSYGRSQESLTELLGHQIAKFAPRVGMYKPEIDLKHYVRNYPGFKDVQFKGIGGIVYAPKAMKYAVMELKSRILQHGTPDAIAAFDSRGYIFGGALAVEMGIPMIMVSKKAKLPGATLQQSFEKEYGTDIIEIQSEFVQPWMKIVLLDDLLATGGTMDAGKKLIERAGGEVTGVYNVLQINDGHCVAKREKYGLEWDDSVVSLVHYDE